MARPDLDFTDVLLSIEFLDDFGVTATTRSMNARGIEVDLVAPQVTAQGIVTPAKDSRLARLPDGSRLAATLDIYTQFPLTNGFKSDDTASRAADIVTWRGRTYTVMAVEDYSHFGQGFIHAQADLLLLNPDQPMGAKADGRLLIDNSSERAGTLSSPD